MPYIKKNILEMFVEARFIDGLWRIGQKGNLDTVDDAILTMHEHSNDPKENETLAQYLANSLNFATMMNSSFGVNRDTKRE